MRKLGPHSRPGKLALVDGRRAEAQLMARVRSDLTKHCGGKPTAVQRMLIDQAALLTLRVHLMDKESIADPVLGERNGRQRLAWSNSLTRALTALGAKATPPKPVSLSERLQQQSAPAATAAAPVAPGRPQPPVMMPWSGAPAEPVLPPPEANQ